MTIKASIFLSILFQSLSIIFGKSAALSIDSYNLVNVLTNGFYFLSLICLFLQAIVWQIVLKTTALNRAYFFMSGVYFIIIVSSYFIFNEKITINNIFGVIIIFIGITNLVKLRND